EEFLQAAIDDRGQAAQLTLDRLGLSNDRSEDIVFRALLEEEVVTVNHGRALKLPVDPTVALLHAAWVPRDVEVEEVGAVVLEVDALSGRVGRDQDPQGMLRRVHVEGSLDLLPALLAHPTRERGEPLVRAVAALDRRP